MDFYQTNGPVSASTLPILVNRGRKSRDRHSSGGQVQSTLSLLHQFEFPTRCDKVLTSPDGKFCVAIGGYKPQIRVWELSELALKFERHSTAELVDFCVLSADWTRIAAISADRSVQIHNQGGLLHSVRLPKQSRCMQYDAQACDLLMGGTGSELYRLNLEAGKFNSPINLPAVEAISCINVSPAHGLISCGTDKGVFFIDPRSYTHTSTLDVGHQYRAVSALASDKSGLALAVGTDDGHSLLYDLRMRQPLADKDNGYGLPINSLSFVSNNNNSNMSKATLMASDRKVIKLWDEQQPNSLLTINPSVDINSVHHVPDSGMIMIANEAPEMSSYYIPSLGPAPPWAQYLEQVTEQMHFTGTFDLHGNGNSTSADNAVRAENTDFKFLTTAQLTDLGLDSLRGTDKVKPYMHGYFISLKLYKAALAISQPFQFQEAREAAIQTKLQKAAASRIRTANINPNALKKASVNQDLADKLMSSKQGTVDKSALRQDDRFKALWVDPAYQVDQSSREYAMLNPTLPQKKKKPIQDSDLDSESDQQSGPDMDDSEAPEASSSGGNSGSDSDQEVSRRMPSKAKLAKAKRYEVDTDPKRKPNTNRVKTTGARKFAHKDPSSGIVTLPKLVVGSSASAEGQRKQHLSAFEERIAKLSARGSTNATNSGKDAALRKLPGGAMEMTFTPSTNDNFDDFDGPVRKTTGKTERTPGESRPPKKVEQFGMGLEKGPVEMELKGDDAKGRSQRRKIDRSASGNKMRTLNR